MAEEMTRAEHLEWCKARALEYVEVEDYTQAYASMASDMGKHPETAGHEAIGMGMMLLAGGALSSKHEMTSFIKGFN